MVIIIAYIILIFVFIFSILLNRYVRINENKIIFNIEMKSSTATENSKRSLRSPPPSSPTIQSGANIRKVNIRLFSQPATFVEYKSLKKS